MWANILAFSATAFFITIIPGQAVAMVLRQTIMSGPTAARLSVLGNSTGLLIWSSASALGLAALFRASPIAFEILKWLGVAYLTFIALQTLWSLRNPTDEFELRGNTAVNLGKAYRLGLITNLTNPKAVVVAIALLPQFVPAGFPIGIGTLIFGCIWTVISGESYMIMTIIIHRTTSLLTTAKARRILTIVSGIGILVLALGVALSPSH